MSKITDRDLLSGIVALRHQLISREQLITSLQARSIDQDLTLDGYFIQQGVMQPEQCEKLLEWVNISLASHNNNVQESLAVESDLVASIKEQISSVSGASPHVTLDTPNLMETKDSAGPLIHRARQQGAFTTGTRFKILRHHARGGLGEVSVAEDQELHREVALKEIQADKSHHPELRTRFIREAEITGSLEHPGIVPIYGLGVHPDGRPFYAMRFIRGESFDKAIRRHHQTQTDQGSKANATAQNLSLRRLLKHFIDVCQAVDFAHSRGVLHRDLKPGNVMLGQYSETLVVDWGLAKLFQEQQLSSGGDDAMPRPVVSETDIKETLVVGQWTPGQMASNRNEDSDSLTRDGSTIGTLPYMSPEQAKGNLNLIGPSSDIFSLGAILFEILTNRPPYRGNYSEALAAAQSAIYPTPRSLSPGIHKGLEAVCLKAIAKEPVERYATPKTLAEDIEAYLADEPVAARKESAWEQAARLTKRHRSIFLAGMTTLFLIAVTSIVAAASINRAKNRESSAKFQALASKEFAETEAKRADENAKAAMGHQQDAIAARDRESATRLETERRVVRLCLSTGAKFNELQDTDAALLWYSQAWQFDPDETTDKANHQLRIGQTLQHKPPLVGLATHNDELKSASVDDLGQRAIALTKSGQAHLWELRQARKIAHLDEGQPVICLALNRAGSLALTGEESGRVHVWDAASGRLLHTVNHGSRLMALDWKPNSQIFATAGGDAGVQFWDAETGKATTFRVDVAAVYSLSFDSAGARFVTASLDGNARVWDPKTGKPLTDPLQNSPPTAHNRARFVRQGPVLSPDGQTVLVPVGESVIHIDIDSGKTLWMNDFGANHQCFSEDGSRLLLSGPGNSGSFVDSASGEVLKTFNTPRECRHSAIIKQNLVAICSSGGLIKLEETETSASQFQSRVLQIGGGNCNLKMLPDRRHFFVASKDGTMRLYDFSPVYSAPDSLESGRANNRLTYMGGISRTHSPDGDRVCEFNVAKPTVVRTLAAAATERIADGSPAEPLPIQINMRAVSARFSNSGEILGLVGTTFVRIWNPKTGVELGPEIPLPNHSRVAWSGDGRRVAFSTGDGRPSPNKRSVRVLDTITGKVIFEITYPAPKEEDDNLATLNEDGAVLATSNFSHDAIVDTFNVDRGVKLSSIPAKSGTLAQLVLTEDGSRLLTVSSNTVARLWDCHTGEPVGPALKHPTYVRAGAITTDGNRVATIDADQVAYLWDGTRGDLLARWGGPAGPGYGIIWFSQDSNSIHFLRVGHYQAVGLQHWNGGLSIVKDYLALVTGKALDFQSGSIDIVPMETFTSRPEEFVRAFRITQGLQVD